MVNNLISPKKCEAIKKILRFTLKFNANHENVKELKEQTKVTIYGKVTQLFVSLDPSLAQNVKIERLNYHIIVLGSTKEYMTYSLTKKETQIDQVNEKVGIMNNLAYLESFFKEKEDLIIALKDKL